MGEYGLMVVSLITGLSLAAMVLFVFGHNKKKPKDKK